MLRVGGILALAASAALAVLVLPRVRSFQGTGLLVTHEDASLRLCMHQALPFGEELRGYPPTEQMDPDGLVHRLQFRGAGAGPAAFSGTALVDVDLRVLALPWPRVFLDGSSIGHDATAYRCTRSIGAFYLILSLAIAAPLLLWSLAALIASGGKREPACSA